MRKLVLLTTAGLLWVGALPSAAQTPKIIPPKVIEKKDLEKKPATLDQLIAEALRNNPDIGVADAKRREAEAELARTRLMVAAKVSTLHGEIEAARAAAEEAGIRYRNTATLQNKGVVSKEERDLHYRAYQKLKSELAAKEAMLPYLLGRLAPGQADSVSIDRAILGAWVTNGKGAAVTDDEFLRRATLDILGRLPLAEERTQFLSMPEKSRRQQWIDHLNESKYEAAVRRGLRYLASAQSPPASPLTEKLRKALDTPSRMQMPDATPEEIMDYLRAKMLSGINVHLRAKSIAKEPIHVKLTEPIPTGAILQYLEDEMRVVFVLRDYGIVVVSADEKLPPGAIRVIDWWKHGNPKNLDPGQ